MNTKQIDVGGITVDVVFKDIKNIHLSVHPPTGRVRISAPRRMKLEDDLEDALDLIHILQNLI